MGTRVVGVRAEHRDGLGIGRAAPRLSWRTETDTPAWIQRSYEIDAGDDWCCGPVESPESVLVPWPGPPLRSRQHVDVRVRVTGTDGEASPWSEPLRIEAGLLVASDWSARFVTPDEEAWPCPYLRAGFELHGEVRSARLYMSALGLCSAEINGVTVGDHVLEPG